MSGWWRWRGWRCRRCRTSKSTGRSYGPKLAQVALTFGADHLDRVSAIDDAALGRRRTPVEDVKRNIAAAGFDAGRARPEATIASPAMTPVRLGAVSYLNTKPLVYGLDADPDLFAVRFDVPAQCARCCTRAASTSG